MIAVHLHGRLADFGGPYRFDARTPAEIVRALDCAFPRDFMVALREGSWRFHRGPLDGGEDMSVESLDLGLGRVSEAHLLPAAVGAGSKGGLGKVILGAAIAAVSIVAAPAGAGFLGLNMGASAFSVFGQSVSFGNLAVMGAAMALNGLSQIISPQVSSSAGSSVDQNASFIFSGVVNTTTEGGPIPLGWGDAVNGGVVISSSVTIESAS